MARLTKKQATEKWMNDLTFECSYYKQEFEKQKDGKFKAISSEFTVEVKYGNWKTMWESYPLYGSAKIDFSEIFVVDCFLELFDINVEVHHFWTFTDKISTSPSSAETMVKLAFKRYFKKLGWCGKHERWYKRDDGCWECEEQREAKS
jgi:hypothetical protein